MVSYVYVFVIGLSTLGLALGRPFYLLFFFLFFLVEILRLPGCPVAHQTPPPRWLISYTSHKPWGFNWNLLVCLIRLINLRLTISRIHCIKESQSFSHCKSFDQPTMELLNNYKFVCLVYLLKFEEFEGF